MPHSLTLRLAGDPEGLPEFSALWAELAKLTHPARPDVDWLRVERLCQSLFKHNGGDLQTAAAFALARTHRQGASGMCEGLALLEALCQQWSHVWPTHIARRLEILVWLFAQWQLELRSVNPSGEWHWLDALARLERVRDLLVTATGEHIAALDALCGQLTRLVERTRIGTNSTLNAVALWPDPAPIVNTILPVVILPAIQTTPPQRRWPWFLAAGLGLWLATTAAVVAGGWWWLAPGEVPEAVAPLTVDLDSLWLFAPGSAELSPDAMPVLVKALGQIQALQPGRLVMISGHSDASGHEQRNLLLSQQRARAVRDWLQRMGSFADSCFVVQGHGSAQPLTGNVAMAGQGVNRRVDIRLIAVAGACTASL